MNKKFYSRSHDFLLFFVLIFVDKNLRKNEQQKKNWNVRARGEKLKLRPLASNYKLSWEKIDYFYSLYKTIRTMPRTLQNTHLSMFCVELSSQHVGFDNFFR